MCTAYTLLLYFPRIFVSLFSALWCKHLLTKGVTGAQSRWIIHQQKICEIIVCFFAKTFAHYFRTSLVIPTKSYVYDDGDENKQNDTFEREPYVVHFNAITAGKLYCNLQGTFIASIRFFRSPA